MNESFLLRLFEHNNWANMQILQACSGLSDEQLDAEPQSAMKGSIRQTLTHLVSAQYSYLKTLTLPLEERRGPTSVEFADLQESVIKSGAGLVALAKGEMEPFSSRLQTRDGYLVDPWVLFVQIINHATEHREQIKSMLTSLGATNPDIDGWSYGEVTKALVPGSTYTVPAERLQELDSLYAQRSENGRPDEWGVLVEDLRVIRRAVEAGTVVTIEGGPALRTWQEFYEWAHGRYHMLEDGYDKWIGNDE